MDEKYRFEELPLDTPDDDPRWEACQDIFSFGFLGRRANATSVKAFREQARADNTTLDLVTAAGPGIDGRQPIAVFESAPYTMNSGAGIVDCLVVQGIVVRPSHRRNGLLKHMMRHRLDVARNQGIGCAVLSVSEGTIYARYGFGIVNRQTDIEVNTERFHLRGDVHVAPGAIEFVHPSFLEGHFDRISLAHQKRYRGAHGRLEGHRRGFTGAWDRREEGPSRTLRAVVHFDEQGEPDGFAVFKHRGWDSSPVTSDVLQVCSPDPAIDRALWLALVNIDLVEILTYEFSYYGDPLPLSLVDSRAVTATKSSDSVWLRILDLERAISERGFESDGSVVLHVRDSMGYCQGTWRIVVEDGVGRAEPTQDDSDVQLGVDTLASMWFGDRTAATLASAGLVQGDPSSVIALSKMFATAHAPVNLSAF
ncbi:MAG: GNAT family N-acetyltransferase [Propionibacteriaceae bacterium]|nr:GNAT family N-acetyltransferase [Propionibacteriaceae bacterium]